MSKRDEIQKLVDANKESGAALTAKQVVEAARDAEKFPELHKHLWEVSEADLMSEARLARAHRLLITLHVTVGEGVKTRLMMHTRGISGYQSYTSIVANPDLATMKLQQLTEDIARARGRLRSFRAALPDIVTDEIDAALATAESRATAAIDARQPEPAEAAA